MFGPALDGRVGLVLDGRDYQVQDIIVVDPVNVRGYKAVIDDWIVRFPDGSWAVHDADEFGELFDSQA